ncbi:hypothetical protein HYU94_01960 [Candidatus Daviesbacteria bacterium]|nr:hypothetical protein [Candidatus Daviesbacteria bacterium]
MSLRGAELEVVQYKTHDIKHATRILIRNFAFYSGIAGTEIWPTMQYQLLSLIEEQTPYEITWATKGMELKFSGFLEPRPLIKDGKLVYESPEPRCVFFEQPGEISPTIRTHIGRVTSAIAREMKEVYYLQIETDPLVLRFPKELYSKRIDKFNVTILV